MHRGSRKWLYGVLVLFALMPQATRAIAPATIRVLPVSPRLRDQSPSDVYDVKSSGLDVVGINQRVYLVPVADPAFASSITAYVWSVVAEPATNTAVVDSNTSALLKFHPAAAGEYIIGLIPVVSGVASTPTTQRIFAARYVGTGEEGNNRPHWPQCGLGCHDDKVVEWWGGRHAHKVENHLNGVYGKSYPASCLECHTLGNDKLTTGSDNFTEVAQRLSFNLSQLSTWANDAVTSHHPHWMDLPEPLQLKSNIQCESCHGPGSAHGGDLETISTGQYDGDVCRQCHDSNSGHQQKVWQWDNSGHSGPADPHMSTNPSCVKCHTAEGFVSITVNGLAAIPSDLTTRNNITCVACHDPHSDANEHQLRKVSAVTLPNGSVFDGGLGNVCANCHNSRIVNPATTIGGTSSRGAHHGPQSDIMLGTIAYDWGVPYRGGAGVHMTATTDTCVTCHMAGAPAGNAPAAMGDHTFSIDAGTTSNVQRACGTCHAGLTSTDRIPPIAWDYDGDGFTSGIQTEVGHLLNNLRTPLLLLPGTTLSTESGTISVASANWKNYTTSQRASVYNFNLLIEEGSRGIHNSRYTVAVLQRSYRYLTGRPYTQDYPLAHSLDVAGIAVVGGPLEFGSREIGTGPSTTKTITIRNYGTTPLNFTGAGIALTGGDAAQFVIANSPSTTPLAAGTTRTVAIAFNPTTVGAMEANLTITTDDVLDPTMTVALSGAGTYHHLSVTPAALAFGNREIVAGASAPQTVTIANDGSVAINFTGAGIALGGADANQFAILGVPVTTPLAPGTSRTVDVVFDPSSVGAKSAGLVITTDYAVSTTVTVGLSGTGIHEQITVSPNELGFGDWEIYGGPSAPGTVTLRNEGSITANFAGAGIYLFGADSGQFVIANSPDLTPLSPGTTRTVEVAFDPSTVGESEAYLVVSTDLSMNPIVMVRLEGEGKDTVGVSAARIRILPVSPRLRDQSPSDVYDVKSSGLDVVGINQRVYLVPVADPAYASSITAYAWMIVSQPQPNTAVVDMNTSSLLKFHPSAAGEYQIRLIPYVAGAPATPTVQRIFAARYVGTGEEGYNQPHWPQCGLGCHDDKIQAWDGTGHAHKVENHLNGVYGKSYPASCLECHTLGNDKLTTGSDNFTEVAQRLSFNLSQLSTWANDAVTSHNPHWMDLPEPLQLKSNIQCESCHGPGSAHGGNLETISTGQLDGDVCRQCHDSATGKQQKVWQWEQSLHSGPADPHMATNASCVRCHSAEGFVAITAEGQSSIPSDVTTRNHITCVACHDPHSEANAHQLRKVSAVTLPNGSVFNGGLGNVCANCHNSRIANPATTINTSSRGAHHGPQSDILLGKTAYDWGIPYRAGVSPHVTGTSDTCVTCHMAAAPAGSTPAAIGDHTYAINTETASNVSRACATCHAGLTTTDRILPGAVDYDGDGYTSGVQTEVNHLLGNLRARLLLLPGTTWTSASGTISVASSSWSKYTFDQKATVYNFNLCVEEGSRGVHNVRYIVGVLQRTYRFLTGHSYAQDFPLAAMLDVSGISVSGGPLDFGDRDVDEGLTASQSVVIRNDGTTPLNFTGAGIALAGAGAGQFAIVNSPATTPLAPGSSRTVEIVFHPTAVGPTTATLVITTNDVVNTTVTVGLSGAGVDQEIAVTPTSLTFGSRDVDAGPSTSAVVTIGNDGTAPLNFTGAGIALVGADAGQFAITNNPATTPLAPGSSRTVEVAFDPSTVGVKSAYLRITTDDANETTVDVALSGTGVDQEITVTPTSLTFGSRDVDAGASAWRTVTIRNDGTAMLSFTGAGIVLAGADAGQFAIANSPATTPLAPGTSRTVEVAFDPSAAGLKNASLRITTDDTNEMTVDVVLMGTGVDQEITVTPTSLAFGSRDVDAGASALQTVTIRNDGTAPLNFTGVGIALTGANANQFVIVGNPSKAPLAPGTSRTVAVAFDPSTVGPKSGVLRITTDDTNEATVDVVLSGTGVDQEITVTPTSLAFGNQDTQAGPTASKTVTIRNDGTAPLNFTGVGIALAGANASEFAIVHMPELTPLAAGASRAVTVVFDPIAPGAKNAQLRITTDDTNETTVTVTLTGTGLGTTAARGSWARYE